jgi:hypothetical protein
MTYYAAQGNAQRIFFSEKYEARLAAWRMMRRQRFAALAYAGSGGFSGPQLYPEGLYPAVRALDRIADTLPALLGTRLLVALEKK